MPCLLREATDSVEPGRERSKQLRGRMEMFGATNKVVICIVLILFVAGCTTMRPLPATDAQSIASQLELGDKVQITRSDAWDVAFRVVSISNERLAGKGFCVAYCDTLQGRVEAQGSAETPALVTKVMVVLAG